MSEVDTDNQLIKLRDVLANYSLAEQPDCQLPNFTDMDVIIDQINILGKKLKETTQTRDLFSNIYNVINDLLIVTDENGKILFANRSAQEKLGTGDNNIIGTSIDRLEVFEKNFWNSIQKSLNSTNDLILELNNELKASEALHLELKVSKICDQHKQKNLYLFIAHDINPQKEAEGLKAIVEAQEAIQTRIADDLHDSLGQELSVIKMLLKNIQRQQNLDQNKIAKTYNTCLDLVDSAIQNLRNTCFDLMPSGLENGSVSCSLEGLCRRIPRTEDLIVLFNQKGGDPILTKEQSIAIFRTAQEFVNNAIKHSECTEITINLYESPRYFNLKLCDNGIGINPQTLQKGRGLQNMKNRIENSGGKFKLESNINQGTKLKINFKKTL